MIAFSINKNVTNLYEGRDCKALATQAILGALVHVVQELDGFCLVLTEDGYQGWVSRQHLSPYQDSAPGKRLSVTSLIAPIHVQPRNSAELLTKLVLATEVLVTKARVRNEFAQLVLPDGNIGFVERHHLGPVVELLPALPIGLRARSHAIKDIGRNAVIAAKSLIGTPYLMGACTSFTIDCSALMQLCYRLRGVQLLRDARLQINDPRFAPVAVDEPFGTDKLRDGDLLFFATDGLVNHVGMALSDGRFIDSSGVKAYGIGVGISSRIGHARAESFVRALRLSTL